MIEMVEVAIQKPVKVIDRFGIFVGRCIASSMSLLGFVFLTISIEHPFFLWLTWPLISSDGLARSIPLLTSAFQALISGFMTGGAGVPIIWRQMHKTLDYESIFII